MTNMRYGHVLSYLCPQLTLYTLSDGSNQRHHYDITSLSNIIFSSMRTSPLPLSSKSDPPFLIILLLRSPSLHFFLLLPFSAGQGADPLVLLTGGATISVDGPYLSSVESLPPGGCHHLPSLPDTRCQLPPPTPPPFRAGHVTTTTSDGLILTCGGQNYFSCLSLGVSGSTWRNHSSLDSLRHYSTHAVLPSGLYLLGGFYSSSSSFLPTGASRWEVGPSLPGMTFDSCAVAISATKFLLIGGWLETRQVSEYDSETGSWEIWPSLVQGRAGHACVR